MPKDTMTPAAKSSLTFAQVLAEIEAGDTSDPINIGGLPPLHAADEIKRTVRSLPIPDLNQFAKLWMLIGEGNTGKTLVARYLVEQVIEHGRLSQTIIAALAAGNRNLLDFAPGTLQPPSADPRDTANWAIKRLQIMQRMRLGGVWDFGGGDTSLHTVIDAQPDMAEISERENVALVAAYLFSPRLDDLAFLKTYEEAGFKPRATALILNLGKADAPSAFNGIRRQPEYKAALDRGAVELWLPAMPQSVALAIEKARVFFAQARDGTGARQADISLIERVMVREWMMRVRAEFQEIEQAGWMPWT